MDPKPTEPIVAPAGTLRLWFHQNYKKLAVLAAVIASVCYFFYPADVLLAGLGLSLIIFLHELGHFLAAKACDVHVKTFSIGFGPPLPFCSFKRGETTYKVGMIPLGGYVAMIGEGDARNDSVIEDGGGIADPDPTYGPESEPDYPRSFKNKSVPQRMLIISAGVIMNILLAGTAFVVAYLNGVDEQPAVVQSVDPGSAAWRAGIRPGAQVTQLNSVDKPWFDDIRPIVNSTRKGEPVDLSIAYRGAAESHRIEPLKMEGASYPQLGVAPPQSLTLIRAQQDNEPPFALGSAAANAVAADGSKFLPGDRIVAMTDPANPTTVTSIDASYLGLPGAQFDFRRRLTQLAGQPIRIRVLRKDQPDSAPPTELVVPPALRQDTGLRMKMGPISALRLNSPAFKAGLKEREVEGDSEKEAGDTITAVEVLDAGGKRLRYSLDPKEASPDAGTTVALLDPLRLPFDLNAWADKWSTRPNPNWAVRVTVQRFVDNRLQPVTLELTWNHEYREDFGGMSLPGSPVPLGGLGLAYRVSAEVNAVMPDSPAHAAGVQPGDVITQVRLKTLPVKTSALRRVIESIGIVGKKEGGSWDEVERNPTKDGGKPKFLRWAFVDYKLQIQAPHTFDLKVQRNGEEKEFLDIVARDNASWPVPADGWYFTKDLRVQKAEGVGEALGMGFHRTVRAIRSIYQGLYGMIVGRISVTTMSGPITLARASYILAGEDTWKLILLIGLISVNLAVVNFLPIPMLDGGHMVFLIYELIRRKPAPESVQVILTWIGFGMVVCLMLFTIGLDIWRLFV